LRRLLATASIIMAIAALAPFSASAQIDCRNIPTIPRIIPERILVPDGDPIEVPVDQPAQPAPPADACKNVPAQGCRGPLPPTICEYLPVQPPNMSTGGDQNVTVLNNSFNPTDVAIVVGQRLYFQNLDTVNHLVAFESCETPAGRSCFQFSTLVLQVGSYGQKAKALNISPNSYFPDQIYTYKCSLHDVSGTFTIAAP
jgi:plastocyanin